MELGFSEPSALLGGHGVGLDGVLVGLSPVQIEVQGNDRRRVSPPPAQHLKVDRTFSRRQLLLPLRRRQLSGPIRILVCAHDLEYGGAQLVLAELMARICDQHTVEGAVLSFGDGPVRRSFEQLGFEVQVSPAFPVSSAAEYESRMEELSDWATSRRYDLALVNTVNAFPGADLCLRLGLPTAWAIHESYSLPMLWATYDEHVDPGVRERAEEALQAGSALVFACQATRACYEPHLPGTRCLTLPYGIDIDELDRWRDGFDAAESRRRNQIPPDATVILCLGIICPRKAQVSLVQAFAQIADRHPKAMLRLVGSLGNAHSDAARLAAAAYGVESRVRIEPVTPDVRPDYANADLLVSASDVESLPRTMLEGMALGVPVLGTNIFGVPELITDGYTGWLCEPRDVEALAGALDAILALDAAERAQVAQNARLMVENEYRSDIRSRAWGELLCELSAG
jgi:D-inositol-3-phosphate glycosyltransferase